MSTGAMIMLGVVLGIFAITFGLLLHTVNRPQAEGDD